MAKLDMRLVANQDPFDIYAKLRKHLDDQGFTDIETELLGPGFPARTSFDAPIAKVVAETYEELYGRAPSIYPTSLGSGPWYQLCTQFGIDACTAGVGNAKSQAHAPNENIIVEDYILGIKHIVAIMDRFAQS
jgi:acetylornithine deacetylase/succinyl-diaminopimelate desuccinylase-like protein